MEVTDQNSTLTAGSVLNEYRIERVLGKSSFGVSYCGWEKNLRTAVTLKEFFPTEFVSRDPRGSGNVLLKSSEYKRLFRWGRQRFISEAQVLAQVRHPNIVRVSRYFSANDTAYIVMDFEEGQSLSELVRASPTTLTESRLRQLFIPLLEGLRVVHDKKYLHRDIKPDNIQIRSDGSPVLINFGAAELEFSNSCTEDVYVLTPGYAPVEQHSPDSPHGPWSDLYAVGATLYHCISGQAPVESLLRLQALQDAKPDPMPAVRTVGANGYGEEFLQVIDWMLKVRPEERPRSVGEVLGRLQGQSSPDAASSTFSYTPKRAKRNYKIVFAGPVGVGKTTAISALSDIPVLNTDARAHDMTRTRKAATTVAMDYGLMRLSESEHVHLYGAPGQERFDFMWDILQNGALGLVLLIDNSRKEPFRDLAFYLHAFQELIQKTRLVIGVNFATRAHARPGIRDYHHYLRNKHPSLALRPPIFEVDARDRGDVAALVQALLFSIDPGVKDHHA